MSSDPISASILERFSEGTQSLMLIEAKAKDAPKDARLSYESVRDLTFEQLLAKVDTRATPKHRVCNGLNELVNSMTSLLCSRHYLGGATGTPTPASRAAVQYVASGVERMLATVPVSAQWVPVAAFAAFIEELRKPI
jgi:hypothetical protein